MSKNSPKVASYVTFDLKIGISVKSYGDPQWKSSKSSHGDDFRDQKSVSKSGAKSLE